MSAVGKYLGSAYQTEAQKALDERVFCAGDGNLVLPSLTFCQHLKQ